MEYRVENFEYYSDLIQFLNYNKINKNYIIFNTSRKHMYKTL